jgi:hypothetical protein
VSDTVDRIDDGVLLVPSATGDNVTETYGVFYPYDGLLVPGYESAFEAQAEAGLGPGHPPRAGAMAVKVTIERL